MTAQDLPLPPCQVTGGELIEPPEFAAFAPQQKLEALEARVAQLELENRCLVAQARFQKQGLLALGALNRYFAGQKLGRVATDSEAILHFIDEGGKEAFDKAHPPG